MEISKLDRKILHFLQKDCRLTKNEIAEATNSSTSSCWRRIQALEAGGIIHSYEGRVDAAKIGLSFSAIVMVSLVRHQIKAVEDFTQAMRGRPEILQILAITGDADFLLRVVAKDMLHYNVFLNDYLFNQACVVKITTNVVMMTIKDTSALPL